MDSGKGDNEFLKSTLNLNMTQRQAFLQSAHQQHVDVAQNASAGVHERLLQMLVRQQQQSLQARATPPTSFGPYTEPAANGCNNSAAALAALLLQQQPQPQRVVDNAPHPLLAVLENALLNRSHGEHLHQLLLNNMAPAPALPCSLSTISTHTQHGRLPAAPSHSNLSPIGVTGTVPAPLNLALDSHHQHRRQAPVNATATSLYDRQQAPTPKFLYESLEERVNVFKTCGLCEASFATRRQYSSHLRTAHSNSSISACTECHYASRSQVKFLKHKLRVHVPAQSDMSTSAQSTELSDASDAELSVERNTGQWCTVLAQRAAAAGRCALCECSVHGEEQAKTHARLHVEPARLMCLRCCLSTNCAATMEQHVSSEHHDLSVSRTSRAAQTEPSWGDLEEVGVQHSVDVQCEVSVWQHKVRLCDQPPSPLPQTEHKPLALAISGDSNSMDDPSAAATNLLQINTGDTGRTSSQGQHSLPNKQKKSPRGRRTYDTAKYPHLTLDGLVVERARQEASGSNNTLAPSNGVGAGAKIEQESLEPAAILNKRYLSEEDAIEGPTEEEQARFSADGEAALVSAPGSSDSLVPVGASDRVCGVCGYQGKWVSEMIRHRRVHTTERPFKCKYCTRTSKWKADLIRHVAKVHGIRVLSKYSRSRQQSTAKRALSESADPNRANVPPMQSLMQTQCELKMQLPAKFDLDQGPGSVKRVRLTEPAGKAAAYIAGGVPDVRSEAHASGDSACGSSIATGSTLSDIPTGSPDMSSVASSPSPKQTHVVAATTAAANTHSIAAAPDAALNDDAASSGLTALLRAVAEQVAREKNSGTPADESNCATSSASSMPMPVITTSSASLNNSPVLSMPTAEFNGSSDTAVPIDLAYWCQVTRSNSDYLHAGLDASTLACTRLIFSEHVKVLMPQIPKVDRDKGHGSFEAMWRCRFCSHTSKRRANVAAHEYTHTRPGRDGRYRCPRCALRAPRFQVNEHYVSCHLQPSESNIFLTEHRCTQCPAAFVTGTDRLRHEANHARPGDNACAQCTYACDDLGALAAHQVVHVALGAQQ